MGFPKLLLAQNGVLLVEKMINRLSESGWDRMGVIVSDEKLVSFIDNRFPDTDVLFNHDPDRGMISSIRIGLDWADDNAAGLLTWAVDHPLVGSDVLRSIRSTATMNRIVIPLYNNRRGHPTWWGKSCYELLRSTRADQGARQLLRLPEMNIFELRVEDEAVLHNINTPEDAARFNLERFDIESEQ